jgi:hypothetical protein
VRHRRGLIAEHKVAQQRLHDQLHALCRGLAAPDGHGRALKADSVIGQAVLDCAAAFAGRPPSARSLRARAHGRVRPAKRSSGSADGGPACRRRPTRRPGPPGWPAA